MSISLSPDSKSFVSGACNASTKVSVVLLTFKNMKILEGTLAMHDWSGAPKLNSNTIMAARFAEAFQGVEATSDMAPKPIFSQNADNRQIKARQFDTGTIQFFWFSLEFFATATFVPKNQAMDRVVNE